MLKEDEKPDTCPDPEKDEKLKANPEARKILFNILDIDGTKSISFAEFIIFLKYSYSFYFFDADFNGRIHTEDIGARMINLEAVIPMNLIETQLARDFRKEETFAPVDLLKFLAYALSDNLFANSLLQNTKT